ncbi:MAG: MGMT family protein [Candidatus Kaelpia imicola]|nr:MGMT family protein [Candidatus Kaelpia imicola]
MLKRKELKKLLKGLPKFKEMVYLKILEIPYGETRSYKRVAEEIGVSNRVRAVARAISENPYPFLIPCHRVIRSDGTPGGYMFGLEIKKKLLDLEKRVKSVIIEKSR